MPTDFDGRGFAAFGAAALAAVAGGLALHELIHVGFAAVASGSAGVCANGLPFRAVGAHALQACYTPGTYHAYNLALTPALTVLALAAVAVGVRRVGRWPNVRLGVVVGVAVVAAVNVTYGLGVGSGTFTPDTVRAAVVFGPAAYTPTVLAGVVGVALLFSRRLSPSPAR